MAVGPRLDSFPRELVVRVGGFESAECVFCLILGKSESRGLGLLLADPLLNYLLVVRDFREHLLD